MNLKNKKTTNTCLAAVAACTVMAASCQQAGHAPRLDDAQDSLSWVVGVNMAQSISQASEATPLDDEVVLQAMRHTLAGKAQPLDDSTMQAAWQYIIGEQQLAAMRKASKMQEGVDALQAEYFAQLQASRDGVVRHPSGFYYEVLQKGKGRTARYGDRVSFDYRSFTMLDGAPYDQTYGKREPIVHSVGKPMFQGLVEGLQLMNAGSIVRFYFPYQLAFGPQGMGDIEPYTPFIYEVELHEIYNN
ncbi:MAG: FKBP-type peptidyl-prolyl cis-trans isomerase [Bacteroidales bacterium]|nr:FKBP-type peptidyl-prolyl cis-trans isomerase [Bacteroidales bacterium]